MSKKRAGKPLDLLELPPVKFVWGSKELDDYKEYPEGDFICGDRQTWKYVNHQGRTGCKYETVWNWPLGRGSLAGTNERKALICNIVWL